MNFVSIRELLIVLMLTSMVSNAQTMIISKGAVATKGMITGVVVDSATNSPIEFANFKLTLSKDTSVALGAVSSRNGRFILKDIPFNSYSAKVSSVGHKARRRKLIVLNEKLSMIDLDTIKLPHRNIMLGEVNISEKEESVIHEKEKIVIPVNRELGDDALEILENIPMIEVDIDGNVSIPGKQSTKIYIDGVPLEMAGYRSTEELKTLTVYEIAKVEVITNPTIEFADAQDGGAINIVLRKRIDNKLSGTAAVGEDTKRKLNSSINLKLSKKFFSPNAGYWFSKTSNNSLTNSIKSISLEDKSTVIEQINSNNSSSFSNIGRLFLGVYPDDVNKIITSLSYSNIFSNNSRELTNSVERDGETTHNFNKSLSRIQQDFLFLLGSYSRKFQDPQKGLLIGMSYFDNSMKTNSDIEFEDYSDPFLLSNQKNHSENFNKNITSYLSYTNAISRESRFSLRYSFDYKQLNMNNYYSNYDFTSSSFIENLKKKTNYVSTNKTHKLSCTYNNTFNDYNLMSSLELSRYNVNSEDEISANHFEQSFVTLTPSVSIAKEINAGHNISLSYYRRYTPPMNKELNPYVDYSDTTNLVVGNPKLKPSFDDGISFSYNYYNDFYSSFTASLRYSSKKDIIEPVTEQRDLLTSVTTYKNVASSQNFSGALFSSFKMFEVFNINPVMNLTHSSYSGLAKNNSGFSWGTRIATTVSLKNFRVQMNFTYSSQSFSAQSETRPFFYTDLTAKALFFDRALTVTLKIADLFNSRRNNINLTGANFYQRSGTSMVTRIISLNISYFFQSIGNEEILDYGDGREYADDF